jgi:Fe-S cluster assembly ATP-binding protein
MLSIKNLHATIADKNVLQGISLSLEKGKVYAIMGPNGSGKSSLSHVIAGKPGYTLTQGDIHYQDKNLLELSPDERARAGVFLSFQYPVEMPGVNNLYFLRQAVNAVRKDRGLPLLDAMDFITLAKEKIKYLGMDEAFLYRDLNVGFSGGEKKRNEILQLLLLDPTLIILDEIDSGLDVDALKAVATGINAMRHPDKTILLITHYQRLLDHVVPDHVFILSNGKIVKEGDANLAKEIEKSGYEGI